MTGGPLVFCYGGGLEASVAIAWLAETRGADVVAMTLDIGQDQPLEPLRLRALACGARRAHVIDARDEFARECALPGLRAGDAPPIAALARTLLARRLVEAAASEGAATVAHAADDPQFGDLVKSFAPHLEVLDPRREWAMDREALLAYARARRLPVAPAAPPRRAGAHLLARPALDPAGRPEGGARLELAFEGGAPVALNGVPMSLVELLESISLIAGQYGLGWDDQAPAAVVLRAAYAALGGAAGTVTLKVSHGTHVVLAASPSLVSLA